MHRRGAGILHLPADREEFAYPETSFISFSPVAKAMKVQSFAASGTEICGAGAHLLGAVCLALIKDWDIFQLQEKAKYVFVKEQRIRVALRNDGPFPLAGMLQPKATLQKTLSVPLVAQALGLAATDLLPNDWQPSVVLSETAHLIVPVRDAATLGHVAPDPLLLATLAMQHGFRGCCAFAPASGQAHLVQSRCFDAALGGAAASGSAAGAVAGFLHAVHYIKTGKQYAIAQQIRGAHPATIYVAVEGRGIWVGGSSMLVMEGVLWV